jgi:hypothetical protein
MVSNWQRTVGSSHEGWLDKEDLDEEDSDEEESDEEELDV